jgi:hypothetical protein
MAEIPNSMNAVENLPTKEDFRKNDRDKLREELNYSLPSEKLQNSDVVLEYAVDIITKLENKVLSIKERLDLQITANDDLMSDYKEAVEKFKELEGKLNHYTSLYGVITKSQGG